MAMLLTCPSCSGSGKPDVCPQRDGTGVLESVEPERIDILPPHDDIEMDYQREIAALELKVRDRGLIMTGMSIGYGAVIGVLFVLLLT